MGGINYLAVEPDHLDAGCGKVLMADVERLLLSVGCFRINFCVTTNDDKFVEFSHKLGYAIKPVHSLGKRSIKDD